MVFGIPNSVLGIGAVLVALVAFRGQIAGAFGQAGTALGQGFNAFSSGFTSQAVTGVQSLFGFLSGGGVVGQALKDTKKPTIPNRIEVRSGGDRPSGNSGGFNIRQSTKESTPKYKGLSGVAADRARAAGF